MLAYGQTNVRTLVSRMKFRRYDQRLDGERRHPDDGQMRFDASWRVLINGAKCQIFRNNPANLSDQFTRVCAFTMLSSYLEGNLSGVKASLLLARPVRKRRSRSRWKGDARRDVSRGTSGTRSPVSRRLSKSQTFREPSPRVLRSCCTFR